MTINLETIARTLLMAVLMGVCGYTMKTVMRLDKQMEVVVKVQEQQAEDHKVLQDLRSWKDQHEGETRIYYERVNRMEQDFYQPKRVNGGDRN